MSKSFALFFLIAVFFSCLVNLRAELPGTSFDIIDVVKTGMPVALYAGVWWILSNRVPKNWKDVPDPAATFIKTTWKEQGFLDADRVRLKLIPADSLFAKVIMYTQELPHALAVGQPFRRRIETTLARKKSVTDKLLSLSEENEIFDCKVELEEIEQKLNQCRFVCGHERVHQEENHTFRMLIIQVLAPFFVYSVLKQAALSLENQGGYDQLPSLLTRGITRSALEMVVFWCSAHWYERKADLHASSDPAVISAGISLFEQAQQKKITRKADKDLYRTVLVWILKYTHPTMVERIGYLKKSLIKNEQIFKKVIE